MPTHPSFYIDLTKRLLKLTVWMELLFSPIDSFLVSLGNPQTPRALDFMLMKILALAAALVYRWQPELVVMI